MGIRGNFEVGLRILKSDSVPCLVIFVIFPWLQKANIDASILPFELRVKRH